MKISFEGEELSRSCAEKLEPLMQKIKSDFRVPPMNKTDGLHFNYTLSGGDQIPPMIENLTALMALGEEMYFEFDRQILWDTIEQLEILANKLREVEEFFRVEV